MRAERWTGADYTEPYGCIKAFILNPDDSGSHGRVLSQEETPFDLYNGVIKTWMIRKIISRCSLLFGCFLYLVSPN